MNTQKTYLKTAFAAVALFLATATVSGSALAQSAADNIRPAGQVCMQGQSCVGQPAGGASAAAPAAAAPVASSAPAAAASAAAEVVAAAVSDFDAAAAYNMSCMACHATGAAGAPKPGDEAAWNERLEKGMEAVMANVMNGVNAMPARGLCANCSDEDLHAIVEYMVSQ